MPHPEPLRWTESGDLWQGVCGGWSFCVDRHQPARGLFALSSLTAGPGTGAPDGATRLFGCETEAGPLAEPSEAYLRGADAIASHPPTDVWPFTVHTQWSAAPLTAVAGVAITLQVSLHTALLDTAPRVTLLSSASGPDSQLAADAWRVRPSVAVVVHPSDAPDVTAEVEPEGTHRFVLAPPFLEKGVIRRLRVAALAFSEDATSERVEAATAEYANLPLALTA